MAEYFDSLDSDLTDVIATVLGELGPMSDDQLLAVLEERGVALGDDADLLLGNALDDGDGSLMLLADDRWVSLPALLDGPMFTHRLTAPEVDHDILDPRPDLEPVAILLENDKYQQLVDGSPVTAAIPPYDLDVLTEWGVPLDVVGEDGVILLPPGYLSGKGLSEGDLITLRVAQQELVLEGVPDPGTMPERMAVLGDRLAAVFEADPADPLPLEVVVWTACADDPTAFGGPLPPLGEVLDSNGLVLDGDLLALPGFDFQRWRGDTRRTAMANRYDLDDDEALAVQAIVALHAQFAAVYDAAVAAHQDGGDAALAELVTGAQTYPESDDASGSTVRAILPMLMEPAVAMAVLAETTGAGGEAAALGLFAETLEPQAPREARPALRWLRGEAYEQLGDLARAEAEYLAAESLNPEWPMTLISLARYASDRTDAVQALSLLRRAGSPPDDPFVKLLERFETPPRSGLGRNEPCWCGSGRKYKKCHLNNEQFPLEDRAEWLYQKAVMFLDDGGWAVTTVATAEARAQYSDDPYALFEAMADPLIADAVLFEGGAFADFVAARGALLPADERMLADQWLLVERSLYEVQEVGRDEGCTVRDLLSGDVHQVLERTATRPLASGDLVCARVAPAGATMQFFGGFEPVAVPDRDELIAVLDSGPDPVELVTLLSRRFVDQARQPAGDAGEATALEQFVLDYERKWLDQRIPALAGRTPREAAADPTRRGDLIRLLDSFPSDDGKPALMNPDRLRSALGLT